MDHVTCGTARQLSQAPKADMTYTRTMGLFLQAQYNPETTAGGGGLHKKTTAQGEGLL